MTADDLALQASGLVRRFGSFVAVDHIDLAVKRGSIFGFLGANGAGKTTTIRMLCGLLQPSSGTALVDGEDVVRRPDAVKARIGYMAQKFSLYGDLTVSENIRFFADVYLVPTREVRARTDEVLEHTGLVDRRDALTRTLPAGIKQRLALACALIHRPRVLFLDEPTAGVDPLSRRLFWTRIHELRTRGTTIFVTTHHLDEAENCTEVMFMQAGRCVGLGPPRELRRAADRGDRVRIKGGDRDRLRASSRIRELVPMGSGWQALLNGPGDVEPLAVELGLPVQRISPSLEDVFLEACRREA
ncbi:MAG: ABC transporter ATP-binding protein [Alphaproteobacteria bacterium]|nr:ABC transporter ATP-binding protein [Alphaproteobacteria bacterium]